MIAAAVHGDESAHDEDDDQSDPSAQTHENGKSGGDGELIRIVLSVHNQ